MANRFVAGACRLTLAALTLATFAAAGAFAQQSPPESCLPSATEFPNSEQLPPPLKPFGGVISENAG